MGFFENIQNWFMQTYESLRSQFILNFINSDRWKSLLQGLGVTLQITLFAVLIGIVIGIIVASIRSTYVRIKRRLPEKAGRAMLC